ncbi:MAG: bifunctional DedA family/phosphatase PAP2 family protein [Solirubrobacterales bacterium]
MNRSRLRKLGLIVVAIVAFVVVRRTGILPSFDLEKFLEDFARTLGPYTYLFVGAMAFLETGAFVGLVAPGETSVILGGAVAGQGEAGVDVVVLLTIAWASAYAGDSVSFLLGRRLGRDFVMRHGERVRISRERFEQVEDYFDRHGGKTILIGRFVGIVRALAPFVAGSSGMRYRAFWPFSVLGTGLWTSFFTLLGYFGSRNLDKVLALAGKGSLYLGTVIVIIVGLVLAVRALRDRERRAAIAAFADRTPGLRTGMNLGRRFSPQLRFAGQRLTPGGLGLEFTTLVAVLAVGVYVFGAYLLIIGADPGPTAGDRRAFNLADNLRSGMLDDAARVVTALGSSAVVVPMISLVAGWLALRRRWLDVGALVVAATVLYLAVPVFKETVGRPRPDGGLVAAESLAFPSGHAAHSVLWVWAAVIVTVRGAPGAISGSSLIGAAAALSAAIGLSRVELRVHWLSDVTAGWGLGVAVFALAAIVVLVVSHLRETSGGPRRPRAAPDAAAGQGTAALPAASMATETAARDGDAA